MASRRSLLVSVPPNDAIDEVMVSHKKKAAERSKMYRQRKQTDTDFKERERERKREYRRQRKENITEEEKNRLREQGRIRQQNFNVRRKLKLLEEEDVLPVTPKKPKKALTRKEHTKMKDYWREKKREQRASMTSQKKRRVREKERTRYARKINKMALSTCIPVESNSTHTTMTSTPPPSSPLLSPSAMKQRAYRVKKGLPKSPNRFAQVISHIIKNATPRKKSSLIKEGIFNSPKSKESYSTSILETMASIKHKRQDSWLSVKRCLVSSMKSMKKAKNCLSLKKMSEDTGLCYRYLKKYTSTNVNDLTGLQRKKRQDCLCDEVVEKVQDHFVNSASYVPDKKAVSRKTLESKKVLEKPVTKLYEEFKDKNPEISISESKFCKLRPSNVKTTRNKKLYQSMCEYCTNTKLKVQAMNLACEKVVGAQACKIDDLDKAVELTVCTPKQEGADFHRKECVKRDCARCGVDNLDAFYEPITHANGEDEITWSYWSNVEYCQPGKRPSTNKTLLTKTTKVVDLINALKKDVFTLSNHLLNAYWQKCCFQKISKKVPENSVVLHMDFSENYATFFQNEVSSAHWMKTLVTVHPIVAFYTCPECGDGALPVMDVLVFLSADQTHDHHAVQTFVDATIKFLKEDRGVPFNTLHEFTDGCSSQYKSRGPFADISFGMADFMTQRVRYFFGSCHGKGPCDGAGGVVKTAARMAVIRGDAVIDNAKSMFTYMKTKLTKKAKILNMCNHSRREFFLVDVNRVRPDRTITTSIKGTRKIHSVRGMTPGFVQTRDLGCVCYNCLAGEWESCTNEDYVDMWSTHELQIPGAEVQRGRGARAGAVGRGEARRGRRGAARGGRGVARGGRGVARGGRGVATVPRETADQRETGRRGTRGARTRGGRARGRSVRTRGGRRRDSDMQSSEDSDMSNPMRTDSEDSMSDSEVDSPTRSNEEHSPSETMSDSEVDSPTRSDSGNAASQQMEGRSTDNTMQKKLSPHDSDISNHVRTDSEDSMSDSEVDSPTRSNEEHSPSETMSDSEVDSPTRSDSGNSASQQMEGRSTDNTMQKKLSPYDNDMFIPGSTDDEDSTGMDDVEYPLFHDYHMVAQDDIQSTSQAVCVEKAKDDVALNQYSFSSDIMDMSVSVSALIDSILQDRNDGDSNNSADNSTMDNYLSTSCADNDTLNEAVSETQCGKTMSLLVLDGDTSKVVDTIQESFFTSCAPITVAFRTANIQTVSANIDGLINSSDKAMKLTESVLDDSQQQISIQTAADLQGETITQSPLVTYIVQDFKEAKEVTTIDKHTSIDTNDGSIVEIDGSVQASMPITMSQDISQTVSSTKSNIQEAKRDEIQSENDIGQCLASGQFLFKEEELLDNE